MPQRRRKVGTERHCFWALVDGADCGRYNVGMLAVEILNAGVRIELTHGVSTESSEALRVLKFIPERFKVYRHCRLPILPQ